MTLPPFIFYLNVFAVFVQITIAGSLFFRRNNSLANKLLALVMLYPAAAITQNIVLLILRNHNVIFIAAITVGIVLTFGPVLLAYIRLIQGKVLIFDLKYFFQFIFAFSVLMSSVYYMTIGDNEQKAILDRILAGEDAYTNFINFLLLGYITVYLVMAHFEVKSYATVAKDFYTSMDAPEIKWTRTIVNYIAFINLFLITAYALPVVITGKTHIYSDVIATPVASVLLYLMMVYKGFSHHAIFDKSSYRQFVENTKPLNTFIAQQRKSSGARPSQDSTETRIIKERVEKLFTQSRIHTEPGLKLHTVAERLDMSPALLSRYLSVCFETTFFDFVNKHRVEEAKRLLLDPANQHLKVESIGEMAGFSSRASFFSVFRKYTNKTPSAFKAVHLQVQ